MLRDEVARYTELSGNDGLHTPIGIIGAYLDGYEKGRADAQPKPNENTLSEQQKSDKLGVKTGETCTDCISRQAAIEAIFSEPIYKSGMKKRYADAVVPAIYEKIKSLPSAQPDVPDTNVGDMINRQDVLALAKDVILINGAKHRCIDATQIHELPSAQPTLYGYSIEHLALIAIIMQKENVTPEKALEYFKDIQRMGQMIIDEQQEIIKRTVEKWTI